MRRPSRPGLSLVLASIASILLAAKNRVLIGTEKLFSWKNPISSNQIFCLARGRTLWHPHNYTSFFNPNLASSGRRIFLIKKLLLFLFVLYLGCADAQIFPVQVSVQLAPPYSPYLSDYTAPGAQKFMLQIRANDITLSDYPVKLQIRIEGVGITVRTKSSAVTQPIVLAGGVPQTFYGEDLLEYFRPDALDFFGISRSTYERRAHLPEGFYRFTVAVLDYNRGTVVSNTGVAMAWIVLNDPPMLNLPANLSRLEILDPANILFSWTPRHSGSPNSAFATEYLFRLVEIWPEGRNPHDAFLTEVPLFEAATSQNQLLYGLNEPALIPGRRYAWQVTARDTEGRDLFRNGGRSEVFVFEFGEALPVPANFQLRWAKSTTLSMRWDAVRLEGSEVKYRLQYRPRRRQEDDQWYETLTQFTQKTLYDLEVNAEYEMRVRAETRSQESVYSPVQVFRTSRTGADAFVCKDLVTLPPQPADTEPVFPMSVNDTLHAAGYDVLVRDIMQMDGRYYGSGVVIVPWFNAAKVRVTFENIRVNDQFWLTSGTVKSVWSSESRFLIDEQTPTLPGKAPKVGALDITVVAADSLIAIQGKAIASVMRDEEGNIVVTATDGVQQILAPGASYAIADAVGNGYVVDKQGNIAKTVASEARAAAARGDRVFEAGFRFVRGNGSYGFDEKQFEVLAPHYQQLDDGSYVAWKALSSARPDAIEGHLESDDVAIAQVRFAAGTTPLAPLEADGVRVKLSLQGKMAGVEEELLALYRASDSVPDKVLGKVNLVTYDPIRYNLKIIPVNGASLPGGLGVNVISESLNEVFAQAVVEWHVSVAEGISVGLPAAFDAGETGLFSNYTRDMQKVLTAFGRLQDNNYYIFLIGQPRDPNALGYMPRNKQAGFVFAGPHNDNATEFLKTLAHELGHGAFNLRHTFSEYNLPLGATDNLMDYSSGTFLGKYQWDYIHEPRRKMLLFDDAEERASVIVSNMATLKEFANRDGSFTFLAPTGIPFTLPPATEAVRFWTNDTYADGVIAAGESPDGALIAFTIGRQTYKYHKLEGGRSGSGYKTEAGQFPYVDMLSKDQAIDRAIIALPCLEGGALKFIAKQVRFNADLPSENYSAEGAIVDALPVEDPYLPDYATPTTYLKAELDFTYTEEARDFIQENQACLNEMVQYVIKAADVIQRNPGYYTLYKACGRYPIKYPDAGETPHETAGLLGLYYDKLKKFPEALLNYVEQLKNARRDLLEIQNPDLLANLLKSSCESDFKIFTFDQRKHILDVLSGGRLQDYWLGVGNNRENIVIYTLQQTPEDQHAGMLELLAEDGYARLKTLIRKCDNQLVGRDNFDKLIDAVTVMVQKIYAYEDFEADIANDRILKWGEPGVYQIYKYECPDWVDGRLDSITFTYHNNDYAWIVNSPLPINDFMPAAYWSLTSAPFDFVPVKVYSDVRLGNGTPLLTRSNGEFQAIPAIYLYWMIHRQATDETMAQVKGLVNVGLFAFGSAEILAARTGLRLTLAIIDQSLFATSFIIEAGPRRLLEEGPNGAEWNKVFKSFDAFNILYGAARLGQGLGLAAEELLSRRALLNQLKHTEDWTSYSPAQRALIRDELVRVEKGMDEMEGVVGRMDASVDEAFETQDDIWTSLAQTGDAADLNSVAAQIILKKIDDHLATGLLPGWSRQRVQQYGHGNYPAPEEYLSETYIENHLKEFENGVSFFCPRDVFDQYGDLLGRRGGVYVIPSYKMDELMQRSGGDLWRIEEELAIPRGKWAKVKMCRVDVKDTKDLWLRMPSGNEEAANEFFTPGGITLGGQIEAVIDQVPKNMYTYKEIN